MYTSLVNSGEIYAHVNLLPIFAHHENHSYDAAEHPATTKAEGDQKAINFFKHITIQTPLHLHLTLLLLFFCRSNKNNNELTFDAIAFSRCRHCRRLVVCCDAA
eukprot:scaffold1786_cov104-Skeletonema_dohrnii-CCMP3373.AAC.3